MTRITTILPFAFLTLATAACVDDVTLGSDELLGIVYDGNGDECPKLGCSSNSAYLGPTEFHELDETGQQANKEGFKITSFTKNGVSYALDVTGTTIVGKRFVWGWGWIPDQYGRRRSNHRRLARRQGGHRLAGRRADQRRRGISARAR